MMTTASFKKENCSPQLAPFAQTAATPSRYSEFKIDSRGATRIALQIGRLKQNASSVHGILGFDGFR